MPNTTHRSMAVRLFGPFDVRLDGEPLPSLRTYKGQWLFALLTLRQGRGVQRDWLAGTLWPDSADVKASYNLRRSLSDLRRALGPEAWRLGSPTARTVCLDHSGVEVDVAAFDAAVRRGDAASLERAVGLYRGPLLEGCTEPWVLQERAPREEAYLTALEQLAARAIGQQEYAAAVAYLRRAVVAEPMRESAQRTLMQALARSGDHAAVMQTFRDLRFYLRDALNTEPAPETRALYQQIREEARRAQPRPLAPQTAALSSVSPQPAEAPKAAQKPHPPASPAAARPVAAPPAGAASAPRRVVLLYRRGTEPDTYLLEILEDALSARGHHVFVDRHMAVGIRWAAEIERQIRTADAVIPLLSAASAKSEMLEHEIKLAQEAAQRPSGKPFLLPVRIHDVGALDEHLARLLDPIQSAFWLSPHDDQRLVAELLSTLQNLPALAPAISRQTLEPVGGAVPLDSTFYIERPVDEEFKDSIARQDSIVLVKGPRQIGKTSLLSRGLQQARRTGSRVVVTDFQKLTRQHLESTESLFLTLALHIARQLDLDVAQETLWNRQAGPNENFERFLRREVLGKVSDGFVWGLDEVDKLFSCDFSSEVFALFRSWHNERSLDPDGPWGRLTLAIAYATEAHLFITDLNQSPFNVGTRLSLEDFTPEQVAELNHRYGGPLRDTGEVSRFFGLVGGHPYLVRRGLHEMVTQNVDVAALEAKAARDQSPFGDHLHRLLFLLAQDRELCEAMKELLRGGSCPPPGVFYRLRSAGVIAGNAPEEARPRCRLYEIYLERYLL